MQLNISKEDQELAIRLIRQKLTDLISTGIWAGITKDRLSRWLNQFKSIDDRYFAAVLLNYFIYRTDAQTIALARQAFDRTLPPLLSGWDAISNTSLLSKLRETDGTPIQLRLIPVRSRHDRPGKSAEYMARILKRDLQISARYLANAKDTSHIFGRDAKMKFVFFDDYLGTGLQFGDFVDEESLGRILNLADCSFVPLIAHQQGINYLQENFPKLKVSAPETMPINSNIFENARFRAEFGNNITKEQCLQYYYELLHRLNFNTEEPLGYGKQGLLLAFSHAIPDNSLPLFWHQGDQWFPLFDR